MAKSNPLNESKQSGRSSRHCLLDYDYGDEDDETEIDFEDLVDSSKFNPKESSSWLKISGEHMEKISLVHIRLNLIGQIIGFFWFIFVYFFFSLLRFKNPHYPSIGEETEGWITPWIVKAPDG